MRDPAVIQQLKKYVLAYVYLDNYPQVANRDEQLRLRKRGREIIYSFGSGVSPLCLALAPREGALNDESQLLSKAIDFTDLHKAKLFVAWLEHGLDAWAGQQQM